MGDPWGPSGTTDADRAAVAEDNLSAALAQRDDLAAENARLRQGNATLQRDLDVALAAAEQARDERDRLQARLDTATAHVDELRGQRDEAREERRGLAGVNALIRQKCNGLQDWCDAARPVVEAAEAMAVAMLGATAGARSSPWLRRESNRLIAAVDAWRTTQVDQKAPETALSATEADDPGQVEGTPERDEQEALMAMQSWDAHERDGEAAPADPAGLDAAIEAGARELWTWQREPDVTWDQLVADRPDFAELCLNHVRTIVRAAAPHLRAAALLEAADEIHRHCYCHGDEDLHCSWWVDWLRERAGRIGGEV